MRQVPNQYFFAGIIFILFAQPSHKAYATDQFSELLPEPTVSSSQWQLNEENKGLAQTELTKAFRQQESALKISITKASPNPWSVQVSQNVPKAISKDSILRLHFWARSLTGNSIITCYGAKDAPYERFLNQSLILSHNWQEYAITFETAKQIPANWALVGFQLGCQAGEVELANISLEDWGLHPDPMPENMNLYNQVFLEAADDAGDDKEYEKKLDDQIDLIRKGGLTIQLKDSSGIPVSGAKVEVRQLSHKFHFGTAIAPGPLFDTGSDGISYRDELLKLFNCVVLENSLKWDACDYENAGTADRILDWCAAHNLPVRGHNLLWPNFDRLPKSVKRLRGSELAQAIQTHIVDYCQRYRGRIYVWDVLNEAVDNHQIVDELGADILVKAFQWARCADPTARLAYNECNILNDNAGANDLHRRKAAEIINQLVQNGAPINSLGIQGHMTVPLPGSKRIRAILDEWAAFKMPIEITEYDLPVTDDKIHAQYLTKFLTAIFSHPGVDGFLMWGFWQGRKQSSGDDGRSMFRRDWSARPSLEAYTDLVFHKWWTDATAKSDKDGTATFRVFLGKYQISARKGKHSIKATISVDENLDAPRKVDLVLAEQQVN